MPHTSSQSIKISLPAIVHNWQAIARHAPNAQCAAVVKANAYGLGLKVVSKALYAAGARMFFVAYPFEGQQVRAIAPDAQIFILNGLNASDIPAYQQANLIPVIGSMAELQMWDYHGTYALHFDTGMNRLGFPYAHAADIAVQLKSPPALILSHFACADEPDHPLTEIQYQRFLQVKAHFPNIPASLANSAGALLDPKYAFDMVRPGIALYGGYTHKDLQPVVRYEARIIQSRQVQAGDTIGYGAQFTATKPMQIAVVSMGYADGLPRPVSVTSGEASNMHFTIAGHRAPVVGRISMDLTMVDVSRIAETEIAQAEYAEIFGVHQSLEQFAQSSNTITYEVLTSLSMRAVKHYTPHPIPCG